MMSMLTRPRASAPAHAATSAHDAAPPRAVILGPRAEDPATNARGADRPSRMGPGGKPTDRHVRTLYDVVTLRWVSGTGPENDAACGEGGLVAACRGPREAFE